MTDIGSQLRAAREAQGQTLEQAFKGTRIKTSFLEAMEANQFTALPGPVQARGFVRSYANYLGLDGEQLASALDAEKTTSDVRPQANQPAAKPIVAPPTAKPVVQPPPQKPPVQQTSTKSIAPTTVKPATPLPGKPTEPGKRTLKMPSLALNSSKPATSAKPSGGLPTWLLIVGAVVLFLVGVLLVISALSSSGTAPESNEPLSVPNSIGMSLASDLPVAALTTDGPVSITLKPREHVWARVTLDGQTAFEGMLQPGQAHDWQAANEIIVETGNGAALTVIQQGQENVLGERGQIVARAWGHMGAVDVPLAVPEVTPQITAAFTNTVQ